MRRLAVIVALVASPLLAACGGGDDSAETDFDPGIAEEYVRDKARADVLGNLSLSVKKPQEPSVSCREDGKGDAQATGGATFTCEAVIVDGAGETLGRQVWEIGVEVDPSTSDSIVRSSERVSSTIGRAPEP